MNLMTFHPKLVTFGIGLAITFVVGTAIGLLDHNQLAEAISRQKVSVSGFDNTLEQE